MIGSNKFKYDYVIQQKVAWIDKLTQSCNEIKQNIETSNQLNSIQYETTINELNSKIGELEVVEFNLFYWNNFFYFIFYIQGND
jgi:hypothetical protein